MPTTNVKKYIETTAVHECPPEERRCRIGSNVKIEYINVAWLATMNSMEVLSPLSFCPFCGEKLESPQ